MSRYIDADQIVYWIRHTSRDGLEDDIRRVAFKDAIERIPIADVQEVEHGKWAIRYEGTYKRAKCYCSVCGKSNGIGGMISNQKKPYCPNCGAKMDLEETENEH